VDDEPTDQIFDIGDTITEAKSIKHHVRDGSERHTIFQGFCPVISRISPSSPSAIFEMRH
jgi:hypothetical protein